MFRPPATLSKRATAPAAANNEHSASAIEEELEPAAAVAAVIARRSTVDAAALASATSPTGAPVSVSAWAEEDAAAAAARSDSGAGSAGAGSPGNFRRPPPPTRQAPSAESRRLSAADGEPDELALPAVATAPRTGIQIPPARSERSASAAPLQMGRPRSSMPPPLAGGALPFAIPPSPAAVGNAALSDALQKRFEAEFNRRHQSELQVQAISKQMDVERAELAAVREQLAECQRALQLSQSNAAEYAATQARLKQQVAELSSEKAMLASQVLALEEQLEELTIPPPPPPPAVSEEADADGQAAPQQQPSVLSAASVLPAAPAPAAPSAGDFSMLQARCAHFERLWRVEKAERESLEIAMESRDIAESSAGDSDSICPIHFHNGTPGADTVVGGQTHRARSRASSGLFFRSEGRPSANSHVETSPVQRQVPDDLEGFDTGNTIRLKPGSMPPPTATAVFAPPTAAAAPATEPTGTSSAAAQPASPSIAPARPGPFPPAPVTLPSSPGASASTPAAAAAAASATVCITELDSGAIASLFSSKYRWSSAVHREYFRREVDEILEAFHDEDSVRAELRLLETQCIAPLQYELVEKIGAGGFGCVYRALPRPAGALPANGHPTSPLSGAAGCSVAIKVINLEDSTDDLANICREISAISEGNSCAQLTRYYGSAVLGTKLWLVMEFVDGGSVLDFIKEKRTLLEQRALRSLLPPGAGGGERGGSSGGGGAAAGASEPELGLDEKYIAIIVREVLWALLFLESQKKFHRDLKAANILLSRSTGSVKLADLGASTQLTDTMTKANTLIGSPCWMAPEIMSQEKYDGKADIWSLGITCLEMATGAPPHYGAHPVQVMNLIVASPPPVLEGEQFTKCFKEFVALCLVKDPEKRPTLTQLLRHAFVKKARKTAEIKLMMQGGTLR